MLNWSLGLGGILGITLMMAGVGLYFLRTLRPNLARDHDIVFAAVALLCGGILLFQSWRLDPILQFAQFLSIGSAVWFAYETVRLRGITTEQAKRSTPMVDDERPVSRVYRAELDELTPLDEQRNTTRRIRSSRDGRDDYRDSGRDGYDERGRDNRGERAANDTDARRSSRPLPPERDSRGNWDEPEANRGMRESIRDDSFSPRRPSSNRPAASPRKRGSEADYVDYRPVDLPEGSDRPASDQPASDRPASDRPRDDWQ